MGFYSFYKIFKDIIRTIFGKKFFRGLLIIIIILLIFSVISPVFATSSVITYIDLNNNQISLTLPEFLNDYYYAVCIRSKGSSSYGYSVIWSTTPLIVSYSSGNTRLYGFCRDSSSGWSSGTSQLYNIQNITETVPDSNNLYTVAFSGNYLSVFTNHDIKNESGSVVFDDNITPPFVAPHFDNTNTDIQNLSFEWLYIDAGDFGYDDTLYFHLLQNIKTISVDNSDIYYYDDVVYRLSKDSDFYFSATPSSYYSIPRYKLDLSLNSTYYFVISSSGSKINQSTGVISDSYDSVFQVVSVNTTNVLTQSDIDNNQMKQNTENLKEMQGDLSNTTPTENDDEQFQEIFGHNLSNEQANQVNTSFFSRLSNMLSSFLDYNYLEDETLEIPLPHTNQVIVLHSNILSSHVSNTLATIIGGFWIYLFGMYAFKFLNNLIVAIRDGEFLNFDKPLPGTVQGQVILTDML